MVRGALASLLGLEPDIEVVAQVARGDEVIGAARSVDPDVALLDIEMPGATGLEALAELRGALPGCRILILTTFGRPGYLRRAMETGASGFLLKDAPAQELASAIRRAVAGERVVDPGLAAAALSEGESPLTVREHEVLVASRNYATVADIAGALYLSPGHGAQPPVVGDAEAQRAQSRGGSEAGRGEGLALRRRQRRRRARARALSLRARGRGAVSARRQLDHDVDPAAELVAHGRSRGQVGSAGGEHHVGLKARRVSELVGDPLQRSPARLLIPDSPGAAPAAVPQGLQVRRPAPRPASRRSACQASGCSRAQFMGMRAVLLLRGRAPDPGRYLADAVDQLLVGVAGGARAHHDRAIAVGAVHRRQHGVDRSVHPRRGEAEPFGDDRDRQLRRATIGGSPPTAAA